MATRGLDHGPSVEQAVSLYAAGYFPMDDVTEAHNPLPFYAAERRAVLELDEASRRALCRRVRRSWQMHLKEVGHDSNADGDKNLGRLWCH